MALLLAARSLPSPRTRWPNHCPLRRARPRNLYPTSCASLANATRPRPDSTRTTSETRPSRRQIHSAGSVLDANARSDPGGSAGGRRGLRRQSRPRLQRRGGALGSREVNGAIGGQRLPAALAVADDLLEPLGDPTKGNVLANAVFADGPSRYGYAEQASVAKVDRSGLSVAQGLYTPRPLSSDARTCGDVIHVCNLISVLANDCIYWCENGGYTLAKQRNLGLGCPSIIRRPLL
jgi:hypothetical protein